MRLVCLYFGLFSAFGGLAVAQIGIQQEIPVPQTNLLNDVDIFDSQNFLENVELISRNVRPEESEAYYKILKAVRTAELAKQKSAANEFMADRHRNSERYSGLPPGKFPVFIDLFKHPKDYQGQLVTLHGYLRLLNQMPAGENDQGLEKLYEAWLYTDDAQGNPVVIIATDIPAGIPTGDKLTDHVSVTGLFFKMYGYSAQDTDRKAPMILAGKIEWNPVVKSPPLVPPAVWYVALTVVVVFVGVLYLKMSRKDRAFRAVRAGWTSDDETPDFSGLGESDEKQP